MKKIYLLAALSLFMSTGSLKATNVVIIQSAPYGMDAVWLGVCNTLGYNASTYPSTILSTDTWFDTTDILIVSYAQVNLTADQIDTIQAFLLQGGRVYMQAEYQNTFTTNIAFQQIVNANGGSFTWAANTSSGELVPMNAIGSLASKPDTVVPLTYYWYGDSGSINCSSHIEPFLEYQGAFYGFIFCVPSNNSRMISQSDQDWVQQSTSIPLMKNILINLASSTYTCVETAIGGLNVSLGPDINICNGQPATLNGTTNGATTYLWSTNETTPTISVSAAGTYWVQASNGNCTGSDTVIVTTGPIPPTTLNPAICANQTYTLPGGAVVSIAGTYADTLTSSGGCDSVVVTNLAVSSILRSTTDTAICTGSNYTLPSGTVVSAAGTYMDTVPSSGNCDSIITTHLSLNTFPAISFLGNDTAYCGAFTRTLSVGNGNNAVWSTSGTGAQITVTAAGTYWAAVTNGCGTIADTITIADNAIPVINLGNFNVACIGQTVLLDAGNAGSTFLWSNSATTETIQAGGGHYAVTVTNTAGCSATGSVTVIADSLSETLAVYNATCSLNNGSVRVIVIPGVGGFTYNWSNGDSTYVITNLAAGTYWVTVQDIAGCTSTDSAVIAVGTGGVVSISSPDTIICPGDSATICATPGGFAAYNWNTGDTGICIRTADAGTYLVSATYSAGCVETSNQLNIHALTPTPVTVSVQGDTLTCYVEQSYQWYLNGNPLPGDTANILIAQQNGNYEVMVKGPNGCYATSSQVYVNTSGISNIDVSDLIKVYPNPSSGNWYLQVNENLLGSWCDVFAADGQIVYKSQIINTNTQITVPNAAAGVYELRITSADVNYNLKLIKLN